MRIDSVGTNIQTTRLTTASSTGPPTSSARKTDRRDHSISLNDRSKMRSTELTKDGRRCTGGSHHFTRYWKTAWRLSSGDVTS